MRRGFSLPEALVSLLLMGFLLQAGGMLLRDYARLPQVFEAGNNVQDAVTALRRIETEVGCARQLLQPLDATPTAQVSWRTLNPARGSDPPKDTDRLPWPLPGAPGAFDPLAGGDQSTVVVQLDADHRLLRVVGAESQLLAGGIQGLSARKSAEGLLTMELRCVEGTQVRTLIHQAWPVLP
jgi:type II secretory pathway pseudopilin PulG